MKIKLIKRLCARSVYRSDSWSSFFTPHNFFFSLFRWTRLYFEHELPINGGLTVRYIQWPIVDFARYSLHVIRSSHTTIFHSYVILLPMHHLNIHISEVSKFQFFLFAFFLMMDVTKFSLFFSFMEKRRKKHTFLLDNSRFGIHSTRCINTQMFTMQAIGSDNCYNMTKLLITSGKNALFCEKEKKLAFYTD